MDLDTFKQKFNFLTDNLKMENIISLYYKEHFRNIILIYKRDDFQLRITRDRNQVLIDVKVDEEWRDYDYFISLLKEDDFSSGLAIVNPSRWLAENRTVDDIANDVHKTIRRVIALFEDRKKLGKG